ncbi:YlmH/Sll1252 family protein [Fusobacterium sp. PH5-44]|uniref:YlmH/Sll1252 family protein n=1 Tax=unclassified Fusobacterium TaxID=2648384 RepID=UPI003D2400FA
MDRKSFYKIFNSSAEVDEFLLASIYDNIELSKEIELPVYTQYFYHPLVWTQLLKLQLGVKIALLGLNNESEKKVLCFSSENSNSEIINFPVKYFLIKNKSKFKELQHKDYLGTIMSLGIKRELIGDLLVKNGNCYGVINEGMYEFLVNNLETVGSNPVKIEEIQPALVPLAEFQEKIETLASLRVDAVVSSLANISRNKAVEKIENGEILINYNAIKEKNHVLEISDTITIRKIGKFFLQADLGKNKKGKNKILFKKFC